MTNVVFFLKQVFFMLYNSVTKNEHKVGQYTVCRNISYIYLYENYNWSVLIVIL